MDRVKSPRFSLLLLLLGTALALLALAGCRQPPVAKTFTVGIVSLNPNQEAIVQGFKDGLSSLGYREGKNITFLYDGTQANPVDIDSWLDMLFGQQVDLIFCLTTPATLKAKARAATRGIPLLFAPVFSPVEAKVVSALAGQEENVTGIKVRGGTGKTLETCLSAVPGVRRIYYPLHKKDIASHLSLEDLRKAAAVFGVEIVVRAFDSGAGLEEALSTVPAEVDLLWIGHSYLTAANADKIAAAALEQGLPTCSTTSQYDKGVLISYGIDSETLGKQASNLAHKILSGIPARDLPVETADYFLGVNLETAARLGLELPDDLLKRADFIAR